MLNTKKNTQASNSIANSELDTKVKALSTIARHYVDFVEKVSNADLNDPDRDQFSIHDLQEFSKSIETLYTMFCVLYWEKPAVRRQLQEVRTTLIDLSVSINQESHLRIA